MYYHAATVSSTAGRLICEQVRVIREYLAIMPSDNNRGLTLTSRSVGATWNSIISAVAEIKLIHVINCALSRAAAAPNDTARRSETLRVVLHRKIGKEPKNSGIIEAHSGINLERRDLGSFHCAATYNISTPGIIASR